MLLVARPATLVLSGVKYYFWASPGPVSYFQCNICDYFLSCLCEVLDVLYIFHTVVMIVFILTSNGMR